LASDVDSTVWYLAVEQVAGDLDAAGRGNSPSSFATSAQSGWMVPPPAIWKAFRSRRPQYSQAASLMSYSADSKSKTV
jgi:hypothetical protein